MIDPFCDEECPAEPLSHKLLVALVEAAVPTFAAYLLSKLDAYIESEEPETDDEEDPDC